MVGSNWQKQKHSVRWDGKNNQGNTVSSGFYVYKVQAKGLVATKKLVFTK